MPMMLENPVSVIGAYKRIVPLARGSEGWRNALRHIAVALLIAPAWLGVLVVYILLTGFLPLWGVWAIYTLSRRHSIHRDALLQAVSASSGAPPRAGGPGLP